MSSYQADQMLYEGKAKQVFSVKDREDLVILRFKDSLTAFNAQKKDEMSGKGAINLKISELIDGHLRAGGVETQFVEKLDDHDVVVKKVEIVPLEVVVRNYLAGSTAKRFGKEEGEKLPRPLVEFYLKDDDLGDPLITDDQIEVLGFSDSETLGSLKEQALKVNEIIGSLFLSVGIKLVDFKLEFGRDEKGQLILADEISPDCCRLWDISSGEKMDKDRFRRDLGGVKEAYLQVLERLQTKARG